MSLNRKSIHVLLKKIVVLAFLMSANPFVDLYNIQVSFAEESIYRLPENRFLEKKVSPNV